MKSMENSDTYFFVATCIASVFGFILAFVINRFVNKLDKKLDQFDTLIMTIQQEVSELKHIVSRHDAEIENLKNDKANKRR